MLRLASIFAGIGFFALTAVSCSSTYDATPDVPGKDTIKNTMRGEFTAVVDGVPFSADLKTFEDHTIEEIRNLVVIGEQFNYDRDPNFGKSISISISNYAGPNTYLIDWSTVGTYANIENGEISFYQAKAGDSLASVTITQDGDRLEGTFNFIVAPNGTGDADNHVIAEGKFSIPK